MDTYTLELRQKEAQVINANGDYDFIVQEKILLEEGDSVVMKSVYIDTEASSNQKINVPHDLTLTMDFIKWWRYYFVKNIEGQPNDPSIKQVGDPDTFFVQPNDDTYIICDGVDTTGSGAGDIAFSNDLFFRSFGSYGTPDGGGFDLLIEYKTFTNEDASIRITIPKFKSGGKLSGTNVKLAKPLVWRKDGYPTLGNDGLKFTPSKEEMASKFNTQWEPDFSEGLGGDIFVEPRQETATVTIEQGAYSPVDLCNTINTQLTLFSQRPAGNEDLLYGNKFLQPEQQYFSGFRANTIAVGGGDRPNVLVVKGETDEATKKYVQIVGANQVELTYLDSVQKFAWNQLHTSYLDGNGTPVVFYDADNGTTRDAYSGVSWTFLGAKRDDTGEDFDFWNGLLGFDLQSLYPTFDFVVYENATWESSGGKNILMANYTDGFKQGEQFTTGLNTIGALVPSSKDTITASGGFAFPLSGDTTNPTNGKNVIIEASNSVLGSTSTFGYFLIEVNAKFGGNFVMRNENKNNIRAIVGRFYEVNSYTSGSEADSLIYTHKGSPVFLESFACRILDSDKNVAPNLGDDNTIFLQVVKALKEPDQQKK